MALDDLDRPRHAVIGADLLSQRRDASAQRAIRHGSLHCLSQFLGGPLRTPKVETRILMIAPIYEF